MGANEGPGYMMKLKIAGHRTAVRVPVAVQQVNKGGVPKIPRVVTGLANVLV